MDDENPNDELRERLRALAAFLPLFEAPGFTFGTWRGGEETKPGVRTMPYFDLSPTAVAFVRTAYEQDWVRGGWDWPAWTKSQEAIALRDDPQVLAAATPEQLVKLLTVLIRQDRFVEGALNGAFESGLLTAIVRRAVALAGATD